MIDFRNLCIEVRALSLLMLCCGDVESNPGPPKPRSEVLRMFMRSIQTDLVHLIYKAKKEEIPSPLYDVEPPGWNTFDEDITFENICNIKKGGSQIFNKLIKLCRRIGVIPKEYIDVILCFEKLSNSRRKTEESEKLKTTLENFMARSKSMKTKEAFLEHLDEEYLAIVLKKATGMLKQGALGSPAEGFGKLIDAANDFVNALEEQAEKQVIPSTSGIKRPATEVPTAVVIKEEKKQRIDDLPMCKYQRSNRKKEAKSKGKKIKTSKGSSNSSMGLRYIEQDGASASIDFTPSFGKYIPSDKGGLAWLFNNQSLNQFENEQTLEVFTETEQVTESTEESRRDSDGYEIGGFTWPFSNQSSNPFENQQTLEVLSETGQVTESTEDSGSDSDGYIPPMESIIGMPVVVLNQTEDNFHEDANLRGMDLQDMVRKYIHVN